MVTGQLGDSRIVLCSSGRGIPLTPEHTPHSSSERKRVEDSGGFVVVGADGVPRVDGMLTITRAFGDWELRAHGVSCQPAVATRLLDRERDSLVVLGSDGLFGMVTSQEVCDIVKRAKTPSQAASMLLNETEMLGSTDNTTVLVVPLFAWTKFRDRDYTQVLRQFKLNYIFGTAVSELPACLHDLLTSGDVCKRDLVAKLWELFDEDADGSLTPEEVMNGLIKLGGHPSTEEVEAIFAIASSPEKQGRLTLEDFGRQFSADGE